jgi:GNAT superfamily N-acetyltransferase
MTPLLIDVPQLELMDFSEYSWCLWQKAYPTAELDAERSRLMWERAYQVDALQSGMERGERFFWIESDSERLGILSVCFQASGAVFYLTKLYLHPDFWGQGLGQRVLAIVEGMAQQEGARRIELYVFRFNLRAIGAYLRAGYRIDRPELTRISHRLVYDDYVMVRDLDLSD